MSRRKCERNLAVQVTRLCLMQQACHQAQRAVCREYSKQLNESRLKVLQARENAVHELVHEAQQNLSGISKDQQKYKNLLTDLLVQVNKIGKASPFHFVLYVNLVSGSPKVAYVTINAQV